MTVADLVVANLDWLRFAARRFDSAVYDHEDLVEDTITKMLVNSARYNCEQNFRSWALAIMSNTYITEYNRKKCVSFERYPEWDLSLSELRSDVRANLGSIISAVARCYRRSSSVGCVVMYAKGYSYEEIADAMGIPVGTVRSRISYGRAMIMKALDK